MATDLVHALLEVAAQTHPFSRERFGHLAAELDEAPPGAALAAWPGLPGPAGEVPKWVGAWLAGLAETSRAGELQPGLRQWLATWAAGQPAAASFLPHWGAALQAGVGAGWRPALRVTVAESWDAAAAYAVRSAQIARLGTGSAELARRATQAFQSLLPSLETEGGFNDFTALERRLAETLQKWAKEAAGAHPVAQEVAFIRIFLERVAPLHTGDDRFWHGLLEGALGPAVEAALPGVPHSPLADPLAVLAGANSRFEAYLNLRQEAPHLLTGGQLVADALELVMLFQLVSEVPEFSLRERWRASLARAAVLAELGGPMVALRAQREVLVEWLRPRYERTLVDWLDGGLEYFAGLVDSARAIEQGLEASRAEFQRLGDDLAVGQKGQNAASRMANLGAEVVGRAAWLGALTPNPKVTLGQFRRALVADLGLDAAEEVWKRHSQLQAGLQAVVDGAGQPALKAGRALLGQIDLTAPATRLRPADVVLPATARERLDAEGAGLPALVPEWFLARLCLDYRLGAERVFAQQTTAWLGSQVVVAAGGRHGNLVRALLAETVAVARPADEDERLADAWRKAADAVVQEVPRLTAAQALPVAAQAIAAETAAHVFRGHPEWALGDAEGAERRGTARMEALLRRVAQVLDPASGLDGGWLVGWWAKDLGAKAAQDPTEQHEETLQALNRNLGRHLTGDEAERVFALVHDTYREVLGVSVAAASLGSKPLLVEGPLHREHLQSAQRWPAGLLPTAEQISKVAGGCGEAGAEVGRQASMLVRQLGLSGDLEAAWQRVMPLLDGWLEETPVADAVAAWTAFTKGMVLGAPAAKRPLWFAVFRQGALLAGQVGLGRKLVATADGFGAFTAGAAQRLLRKDFGVESGREAERLLAETLSSLVESLGRRLREDGPEMAVINTVRAPLELLVAQGGWSARAWDFTLQSLFRYLGPRLDAAERRVAGHWQARLGAAWGALPEFRPLAQAIFASTEYTFSARPDEEQTIRMAVSALAAAVLAERSQAGAGRAAVVRFALATELPRYRDARKLETVFKLMGTTLEDAQPRGFEAILDAARDVFRRLEQWSGRLVGLPGTAVLAALGADRERLWTGLQLAAEADAVTTWRALLQDLEGARNGLGPTALAQEAATASITATGGVAETAQLALAALPLLAGGDSRVGGDPALGRRVAARVLVLVPVSADVGEDPLQLLEGALPGWRGGWLGFADGWTGARLGMRLEEGAEAASAAAEMAQSVYALEPSFGGFEPARADFDYLVRQAAGALGDPDSAVPGLPLAGLAAAQAVNSEAAWQGAGWLHGVMRKAAQNSTERRLVAEVWERVLLAAEVRQEVPAWLGVEREVAPAWAHKLVDAGADLCTAMAQLTAGGAELQQELLVQMDLVLGTLARGGDPDLPIEVVKPRIDAALEGIQEGALVNAWRAMGRAAATVLGPAWVPLCSNLGAEVAAAVAEVAAGRRWQEKSEALTTALRGRMPYRGADAVPEVRELIAGIIDVAALHLRRQATVGAAEADARFAAGVLGFLGDAARPAWLGAGRLVAETLAGVDGSMAARGASRRSAERLAELWAGVPAWRPAAQFWRLQGGPWQGDGVAPEALLAVAASGMLSDGAGVSGKAILQRLVLRDPVWTGTPAKTWGKRTAAWLEVWNEQTERAVPAGVARRISELPRAVELVERARESSGFPLGLGCALRSLSPAARGLWGGSLMARVQPETGLGSPEPVDLAVSQLAGWAAPEDTVVLARLKALESVVALADSLEPAEPKGKDSGKGGFLSSLFGRRKAESGGGAATDSGKYQAEAYDWLVRLAAGVAVDFEVAPAVWLWEGEALPRAGVAEAEARATYHRGIAEAMAEQFGPQHGIATAYRAAAATVPAVTLAWLIAVEGDGLAERLLKAMPGAGLSEVAAWLRPLAAYGIGLVAVEAGEGIGQTIRVGDRSILATAGSQLEAIRGVIQPILAAGERKSLEASLQGLRQVAVG